jgi:NADH dehydrogenase [ubiquinone] 1 alpha subcomplex assembly factor 6
MATIPGYEKRVRAETPIPDQRSALAETRSDVTALVRRHDRDRFQTALFAPAAHRDALFALYAFNYEIARVRESVSEPTLGRIRLEWWREMLDAAYEGRPPRRHLVAEALSTMITECRPARAHFDALIDARAADLDDAPPADLAALENYAEATSSTLVHLALEVLGVRDAAAREAGHHVGIAYALAGLLCALPARRPTWRPIIPANIASRHGLADAGVVGLRGRPGLAAAVAELVTPAEAHLRAARQVEGVSRRALSALLPAVVADRSLRQLRRCGCDPYAPAVSRGDPLQAWRLAAAALRGGF